VCSKKTIAPRCRGSRSRGGRGRETLNRSLIFGRGRRSSVNDRRGDTTKGHRLCRPSCFFDHPDVKELRQGGRQQRTRLRRSWCLRPRQNRRGNDRFGREGHNSDGSSREDAIQPKGWRIEPERSQQRGSVREGRDSDRSSEGGGRRGGPAGQGPAPDLARGVDDTGDGRSSKWEALLGRQREQLGGG
jgi:hypothetical protein